MLTRITSSFEEENTQTQYSNLSYRIDLHFHDYNLAIEIDEKGHRKTNIDYKIKRQKAIKKELGCKFIRIDSDKEEFDIFRAVNEIFRHIKLKKLSTCLLGLEFKSDNIITSKTQIYC